MKLIEAISPIRLQPHETVSILKWPDFSFPHADEARAFSEEFTPEIRNKNLTSLRNAIALGTYNYLIACDNDPNNSVFKDRLLYQFERLIKTEIEASQPENNLPTIGIEVESPRKPYAYANKSEMYNEFSEKIGLRKNGASNDTMWEFAPVASYSSDVQSFILRELIKGGFIASLANAKDPESIKNYLDGRLVSLHINLGIPKPMIGGDNVQKEFALFNTLFAIAFTSSLRLSSKGNSTVFIQKNDVDNMRTKYGEGGRLELKSFEVRDSSVYRLMKEVQLVAANLMSYIEGRAGVKALGWEELRKMVSSRLPDNADLNSKQGLAKLSEDKELAEYFRQIITVAAHATKLGN